MVQWLGDFGYEFTIGECEPCATTVEKFQSRGQKVVGLRYRHRDQIKHFQRNM